MRPRPFDEFDIFVFHLVDQHIQEFFVVEPTTRGVRLPSRKIMLDLALHHQAKCAGTCAKNGCIGELVLDRHPALIDGFKFGYITTDLDGDLIQLINNLRQLLLCQMRRDFLVEAEHDHGVVQMIKCFILATQLDVVQELICSGQIFRMRSLVPESI